MNSGLCRGDTPSLRNTRPISNTRSAPPTINRFRCVSRAMRRNMSMPRASWWVTNGVANPPDGTWCSTGVSTSMNPRASSDSRIDWMISTLCHHRSGLLVDDEVDVALAVALLHIDQAMPLLREGSQTLGEKAELLHLDAEFAALGGDHLTGGAHPVAAVEVGEGGEAVAEGGGLDEELDVTGVVSQHPEGETADLAGVDQATGDGDGGAGGRRGGEVAVAGVEFDGGVGALEADGVGLLAGGAHRLDLGESAAVRRCSSSSSSAMCVAMVEAGGSRVLAEWLGSRRDAETLSVTAEDECVAPPLPKGEE